MKRRRFLLLPATLGVAANSETTADFKQDGRLWKGMSQDAKLNWVMGYSDGIIKVISLLESTRLNAETKRYLETLRGAYISGFSFGEITNVMDKFYEDPANIAIDMQGIYSAAMDKFNGKTQLLIDHYLEQLRSVSAK